MMIDARKAEVLERSGAQCFEQAALGDRGVRFAARDLLEERAQLSDVHQLTLCRTQQ
jgi:hypothetical protein